MTNPKRTAMEELFICAGGETPTNNPPVQEPKPGLLEIEEPDADDVPMKDPDRGHPIDDPEDDIDPVDDNPTYIEDTFDDRLDDEHGKPSGPSEVDEPPNFIEGNNPEDALAPTDPDGPMVDRQNPDAGIKEIADRENPNSRSPI